MSGGQTERAVATAAKTWGETPRQTVDFRELLGWDSADAVLIATPDFAHSRILKAAVEAGKDVHCEKPMGTDSAEAKAAYLAVRNSKQVVYRSAPNAAARARTSRLRNWYVAACSAR
jgi:predicted dehydrogenase